MDTKYLNNFEKNSNIVKIFKFRGKIPDKIKFIYDVEKEKNIRDNLKSNGWYKDTNNSI